MTVSCSLLYLTIESAYLFDNIALSEVNYKHRVLQTSNEDFRGSF